MGSFGYNISDSGGSGNSDIEWYPSIMYPDNIVINSGFAMNYWSDRSRTNDKWHSPIPYTNDSTWLGYNGTASHIAAICFKTGHFIGKAKKFSFSLSCSGGWSGNALICAWQLSRHNWKTQSEWAAGSKKYYATTGAWVHPRDPNAVAWDSFSTKGASLKFSGEADIYPNTQYVFYIWRYGKASDGMIIGMSPTNSRQPTITITG